jgi:hypothetical protein
MTIFDDMYRRDSDQALHRMAFLDVRAESGLGLLAVGDTGPSTFHDRVVIVE